VSEQSKEREQLLGAEAFASLVAARIVAADDLELRRREGMKLTIHQSDADIGFNLETFYEDYQAQPEAIEQLIEHILATLRQLNQDRHTAGFAEISDRVFPMLKPLRLLANVRERKLPMLIYRPFLSDLIVSYVIDETSSVAYLNEEHLEHWGIGEQDIHAAALANLRRRTETMVQYTTVGEGNQRLYMYSSQDGYDATRILLPELLEQWRPQMSGRMAIGIPNRDFLIAFGDSDPIVVTNILRQIQVDAQQQAYGLTDQLFTIEHGQIRLYEEH
jgi:uncharacterized protein YtpQ (UPF0354 family)